MKYRVCWKSKITTASGRGEPLPKETAEAWVKDLTPLYPALTHWIEPVDTKENDETT